MFERLNSSGKPESHCTAALSKMFPLRSSHILYKCEHSVFGFGSGGIGTGMGVTRGGVRVRGRGGGEAASPASCPGLPTEGRADVSVTVGARRRWGPSPPTLEPTLSTPVLFPLCIAVIYSSGLLVFTRQPVPTVLP